MADAPRALHQVENVLDTGGIFILEFANKRNFKAIGRYLFRRQPWNPFSLEPVEFVELNFDFHPRSIRNWLKELDFKIERTLTLSHFRVGLLKRFVPTNILVFLDSLAQWTGALWQFTPSVFVRARAGGDKERSEIPANPLLLFKCPHCGRTPLIEQEGYLECSNCQKRWEFKDGIYDFREPIEADGSGA